MSLLVSIKKLYQNCLLLCSLLIYFAALCFFLYENCFLFIGENSLNTEGIIGSTSFSNNLLIYVFIFFLFISYEYCKDIRQEGISESIRCYYNSEIKLYFSHILILSFVAFLTFLLFYLFNLTSFNNLSLEFNIVAPEYKNYLLKHYFIYSFLVPMCAVLSGVFFSAVFKRISAYLGLLLFFLLTFSTQVEGVLGLFYIIFGDKIFKIIDLFTIFPDGLDRRSFFWSAYPIAEYKLVRPCILIAVALFFLIIFIQKRKHDIKNVIIKLFCFLLCVVLLYEYSLPSSKLILNENHPESSTFSDVVNYGNNEYESAEFTVLSYEMVFDIDKELSANVLLHIDDCKKEKITFTLWNGYRIYSIEDGFGNALSYTREQNYVTIENPSNNCEIRFKYKGHSNRFLSNSDIVYLAGYFPYYPLAGKCNIINTNIGFSFDDNTYDYKVNFDVVVNSNKNVLSNVSAIAHNKFSGKANSICLFSGFIDEITVEGVNVIYPYTDYATAFRSSFDKQELDNNKQYNHLVSSISKLLELNLIQKNNTLVIIPSLGQQIGEDFMVTNDVVYVSNTLCFLTDDDNEILQYFGR